MKLYLSIIIIILFIPGCSKEIKLDLPVYEPKMVLEFYLENNNSLQCLLQESINYTDTARFKLIDSAVIIFKNDVVKDTLFNTPYIDLKFEKVYNYYNPKLIQLQPNTEYEVYVKDKNGREMKGKTKLSSIVSIDTLVYNYNSDNKAAVGLIFNDNGNTKNYYRIVAFKDSAVVKDSNFWDIRLEDILFNGQKFSFYTGYAFNRGDTITARLYHLTEDHNNFTESVNDARAANANPFGQPANIISNVSGGIGIFTTIVYDERKIIIR